MQPAPLFPGPVPYLSDPARLPRARQPHARTAVTLGAAFAILGAALFGLDVPSGLAQGGFFDELFGGGPPSYFSGFPGYRVKKSQVRTWRPRAARYAKVRQARVAARPQKARYAHLRRVVAAAAIRRPRPTAVRAAAPVARPAPVFAARPAPVGRRSVCVRACDGYFFPLASAGGAADVAAQQASCSKVCPDAETRLFVMRAGSDKIEDAVAARGGQLYSQLAARFNSAEATPNASCSCHATAGNPVAPSAFLNDFTLRPGDSVVTANGVRVLKVGSRFPYKPGDFLSLADTRNVPTATRGALAAIEKAMKTPRGRAVVTNDKRRHREQRSENTTDAARPKVQVD